MKIVVMWEDPDEEDAARMLAEVLPRIAPSLSNAVIAANGSVSVRLNASQRSIRVRARACPVDDGESAYEEFRDGMLLGERKYRRAWDGDVVSIRGGRERDWAPCEGCGVPKYAGAQCAECEEIRLKELRRKLFSDKPVEPQRKPPKETRELIFPED